MKNLILPKNYTSKLTLIQTEEAIKFVKDNFERELARSLDLVRVSAPLMVFPSSGLNDDLNGHERTVSFDIRNLFEKAEIVQSLAKWKRNALAKYKFGIGKGLYTDMNAIRRDEDLDNVHSVYVDQWDWEKIITAEQRNLTHLKHVVTKIYNVIKRVQKKVCTKYTQLSATLPNKITFVTSQQLLDMYPNADSKQREYNVTKKYGAVCIMQIGGKLSNGLPHDGRAADYDDWNLNCNILLYYPPLDIAMEISSMGIRVDGDTLISQLEEKDEPEKLLNAYSQDLMRGLLPLTIGGGIGQSRLCMFMLEKAHIGEVQVSVWNSVDVAQLEEHNVHLL